MGILSLSLLLAPQLAPRLQAEQQPILLRFGWPAQGRVQVREESLKKGRKAVLTYALDWAPAEDGSGTWLRYDELEFVSIEGLDFRDPDVVAALAEVRAMAAAIPTLTIDHDGNLSGFLGFEEIIGRVKTLLLPLEEEELQEKLSAMLAQPEVQAIIENKVADIWRAWVGNWVGLEPVRGTSETRALDVAETGGVVTELELTFGERSDHRGVECVEITMEAVADEALLRRQTLETMGVLARGVEVELPAELPIARMTRRDVTHGIYAVGGLRPLEVETSTVVRLWEKAGDEAREQVERHHYLFEWSDLAPPGEDD